MFRVSIPIGLLGLVALGLAAPAGAAGPPAPGTCLQLTGKQWNRSTIPAVGSVDCAQSHTAEVMGTVPVPNKIWRKASGPFWVWAYRKCHTVGVTYVWGNESAPLPVASYARPMSAQLATYEPTRQQIRAGQRWVACVGFNTTAASRVSPRVGTIAYTGLQPTMCVSRTTWRMQDCLAADSAPLTNVVWLKNATKYPGDAQAVQLAQQKCQALASSRGMQVRTWYVPGKSAWGYGNHFGYCEIA